MGLETQKAGPGRERSVLVAATALLLLVGCSGDTLKLGESDPVRPEPEPDGSSSGAAGTGGGAGGAGGEDADAAASGRGGTATDGGPDAGAGGMGGTAGNDAGGPCSGETCPVVLAADLNYPIELALDDDAVFWVNLPNGPAQPPGSVAKVSKTGGAVTTLASEIESAFFLAVDGTNVYFTDLHRVYSTPKSGGSRELLFEREGAQITELLATASGLFLGDGSLDHGVWRIARRGDPATDVVPGLSRVHSIATDAAHVYWMSDIEPGIFRQPLAGGRPEQVIEVLQDAGLIYDIAVTPCCVFAAGHSVVQYFKDGAPPVILGKYGQRVATDTTFAYWTQGDGTVRAVRIDGGEPSTLASGLGSLFGIAVDSTGVYVAQYTRGPAWTFEPFTGKILKLRKPQP